MVGDCIFQTGTSDHKFCNNWRQKVVELCARQSSMPVKASRCHCQGCLCYCVFDLKPGFYSVMMSNRAMRVYRHVLRKHSSCLKDFTKHFSHFVSCEFDRLSDGYCTIEKTFRDLESRPFLREQTERHWCRIDVAASSKRATDQHRDWPVVRVAKLTCEGLYSNSVNHQSENCLFFYYG